MHENAESDTMPTPPKKETRKNDKQAMSAVIISEVAPVSFILGSQRRFEVPDLARYKQDVEA